MGSIQEPLDPQQASLGSREGGQVLADGRGLLGAEEPGQPAADVAAAEVERGPGRLPAVPAHHQEESRALGSRSALEGAPRGLRQAVRTPLRLLHTVVVL